MLGLEVLSETDVFDGWDGWWEDDMVMEEIYSVGTRKCDFSLWKERLMPPC